MEVSNSIYTNMNTKQPNGVCASCGLPLYRKPSHWAKNLKAFCNKTCRKSSKSRNIAGQRFGKLLVIKFNNVDKWNTAKWECLCDCGKTTVTTGRRLINGTTKSCGCIKYCVGYKSPTWKNGKTKTPNGYVRVRDQLTGKVLGFEHVVVMAQILGRPLYKGESVHHKNGIRDDNRPENLELRASQHGKGQAIEDLIQWAKEILARYDDSSCKRISDEFKNSGDN